MSKQTHFVHIEEDIHSFLSFLEQEGGWIIWGGRVYKPFDLERQMMEKMGTDRRQYQITTRETLAAGWGQAIELSNCYRGNPLSRTYEIGRIYLTKTENGTYDEELLALFQKLHSYIRKTYSYSRNAQIYYSDAFKMKYDVKYYFATRAGWRVTL